MLGKENIYFYNAFVGVRVSNGLFLLAGDLGQPDHIRNVGLGEGGSRHQNWGKSSKTESVLTCSAAVFFERKPFLVVKCSGNSSDFPG